jgi:putative tryptophan/tyrosine transport system substrate-binding protein
MRTEAGPQGPRQDFLRSKASALMPQSSVLIFALCAMFFALCASALAQQPKKISRIGYLSPLDASRESSRAKIIRQGLRDLGYIEGQNIAIEYRYAEGKRDQHARLAVELAHLNVDAIIVAGGEPLIRPAMNATKTIPIVMTGSGPDPVEAGFIESFARPGKNVTGLTYLSTKLGGKRLELLKEAAPKLSRVTVLYDRDTPGTAQEVKEDLPVAARALGLTIRSREIHDADGLAKVFSALTSERPDGLYVPLTGAFMRANGKRIADFALKSRLPSLYGDKDGVHSGGLMYYGADLADIYRRVAIYVDKILKGTKPADLPVERPKKFELVINLKTAKQIGLTIPRSLLYRADKVIK